MATIYESTWFNTQQNSASNFRGGRRADPDEGTELSNLARDTDGMGPPLSEVGRTNTLDSNMSNASTRSEKIFEDMQNGDYECMICYDELGLDEPLWSCRKCHHVLHFMCINGWSVEKKLAGEEQMRWPCPTCKTENLGPPEARCWCQRDLHDDLVEKDGNTCGRECNKMLPCPASVETERCVGFCDRICHPGPCERSCAPSCMMPKKPKRVVSKPVKSNPTVPNTRIQLNYPPYQPPVQNNPPSIFWQRWSQQKQCKRVIFLILAQAGTQAILFYFGLNKHIPWRTQPLSYERFTERGRNAEKILCIVGGIIFLIINTVIVLCSYPSLINIIVALFNWRSVTYNPPTVQHNGRANLLAMFISAIGMCTIMSTFIVIGGGPVIAWNNQMKHSCEGFETRIKLDNKFGDEFKSSPVFTLFTPRGKSNNPLALAAAGIDTFNIVKVTNENVNATDSFHNFYRVNGHFEAHVKFAIDFDLAHHLYRTASMTDGPWSSYNSLPKDAYFRTSGSWNLSAPNSPHIVFPELNLMAPNLDRFTRSEWYQPFMLFFNTIGMDDKQIEAQAAEEWSSLSKPNVVMRTASFGMGKHGLEVCARRYQYPVKVSGGSGVRVMDGLGENIMVPLGLMAVLR